MRASAVSFAYKLAAAALAALLTFTLTPFAYAEGMSEDDAETIASDSPDQPNDFADSSGEFQEVSVEQDAEGSPVAPMLASGLAGKPGNFINSDVALDGEPVIGSFTVDGLTFAVVDESHVELVGVSPGWQQVTSLQEGEGPGVAPMLASGPDGTESDTAALALPETVTYEGTAYTLASIAAYAFYLSGVTSVTLPLSVNDVDDRAFRSSDAANVTVAEGNPTYSSFDGALYDADQLSLLLIPEGKQGTVRIPKTAEIAEASVFSHCPLVNAISVDAGSAAFASENGLLYDSNLTTLLRVPAGATEITIREGCTTVAAGALEACADLTTINAPSTVTSISPDIFHAISTVSLLAASLTGAGVPGTEGEPPSQGTAPQLTAVIALSASEADLPKVDPSDVVVRLPAVEVEKLWRSLGFRAEVAASPESWITDVQAMGAQRSGEVSGIDCNWIGFEGTMSFRHYAGSNGVRVFDEGGVISWEPMCRTFTFSGASLRSTSVSSGSYYYDIGIGASPASGVDMVEYSYSIDGPFYEIAPGQSVTLEDREAFIWLNGFRYTVSIDWVANADDAIVFDRTGVDVPRFSETLYRTDYMSLSIGFGASVYSPEARRYGYRLLGWCDDSGNLVCEAGGMLANVTAPTTLYAQWERVDYTIGFDVDSEPNDESYKGELKEDQIVNVEDDLVSVEDPKRPGYVFQGWTIPNAEGTEAIDQDLVYQGDDGKWYVDASNLPYYAGDDGRVELTARWTSIISVDVPSSVTFYADVVAQDNESREGLASGVFGQNKVQSQSEVDLRIVGLESEPARGNGTTNLGATDLIRSKDGKSVSTTVDMLFSIYPVEKALSEDDLKDPDRKSKKPEDAVDFALDDILLEKAFAADKFSIPAGKTLSLGYRLNLEEEDAVLDYEKLAKLPEKGSASIANISYCFSADAPVFWTTDDDGSTLGLASIKADAEKIAAGDTPTINKYTTWMNADHRFYVKWYDQGVAETDNPTKATVYGVRIIGLNHDNKAEGAGKAGITFQFVDCLNQTSNFNDAGGATSWGATTLYAKLNNDNGAFWAQAPSQLKRNILTVIKNSYDVGAKRATHDRLFLLSISEIITPGTVWPDGTDTAKNGWGELAKMRTISPQYGFWKAKGTSGMSSTPVGNQLLAKKVNGMRHAWATRSISAGGAGSSAFVYVASVGTGLIPNGSNQGVFQTGVSPAFCL